MRRSCVREWSSQPHTPKGTAARLLCPDPAPVGWRVPRSMHEGLPVTQWLLPCTGGLPGIHVAGRVTPTGTSALHQRCRRPGRASSSVSHATGGARQPDPVPHRRERTAAARRARRAPRSAGRARSPCGAGAGTPDTQAGRGSRRDGDATPGTAPTGFPARRRGDSRHGGDGLAARWRGYTGRLTGFHARGRIFSANFRFPCIRGPTHPSTPVRPARKGPGVPCAPYGDWPLRQGALPCTPHECNPS